MTAQVGWLPLAHTHTHEYLSSLLHMYTNTHVHIAKQTKHFFL